MTHADCYRDIEKELERQGLDFEIHGLPGADDIIAFEEYWFTNVSGGVKLFPAIVDAEKAKDLDGTIVRAVQSHAQDGTTTYNVVLCGEGWTEERVEALRRQVANRLKSEIALRIESLTGFAAT
jgi:hypothetical protein